MEKPCIVLQTDFRLTSGLVASMYGVIKQVDPALEIYDLNHNITEYDTRMASAVLRSTMPFWPKGTIFVSVVDPGVGTSRRACIAKTSNGYYVVTPDNGTLTYEKMFFGIDEVREIDETVNRYKGTEKSHTFHGRDLFAYCAARLASGVITWEQVGPAYPVDEIVMHEVRLPVLSPGRAEGEIVSVLGHFGNVNTSIDTDGFETTGIRHGDTCHIVVRLGDKVLFDENVLYHKSFGYVEKGQPIFFNGSSGYMGMALNQGNLLEAYFPQDCWTGDCTDWKITVEAVAGQGN